MDALSDTAMPTWHRLLQRHFFLVSKYFAHSWILFKDKEWMVEWKGNARGSACPVWRLMHSSVWDNVLFGRWYPNRPVKFTLVLYDHIVVIVVYTLVSLYHPGSGRFLLSTRLPYSCRFFVSNAPAWVLWPRHTESQSHQLRVHYPDGQCGWGAS